MLPMLLPLGEDAVGFWHELDSGFGGRKALIDLS
jgi:hypothetical protein